MPAGKASLAVGEFQFAAVILGAGRSSRMGQPKLLLPWDGGTILEHLIEQCDKQSYDSSFIGMQNGQIKFHDLRDFDRMIDAEHQRPKEQWWLELKPIATLLSRSVTKID